MKKLKLILTGAILTTFASCVNGDHYGVLESECATMTPTVEIVDLNGTATTTPQQWIGEDVLEAYAVSSDEGGNFYKSISMVGYDTAGNEYGFSIPVDQYNLYTQFEPGRKVYINLNELYFAIDDRTDALEIGTLYEGQVGRIAINRYEEKIIRSCEKIDEEDLVITGLSITEAQDDQYLNRLIEFDYVQFANSSLGFTYFDANLNSIGGATNHILADEDGNTLTVRVSEYATFAGDMIPDGNGKVRGVMTKYNSSGGGNPYQFMIRTLNDVMLDNPRVDFSFLNTVNEDFESYDTDEDTFVKYFNIAMNGNRLWQVKEYSSNQYIQMSSYNSGSSNRSLFVIPVNFDNANNLSFKTRDGYNNGDPLKVYYSTDFDPSNPTSGTLNDITSNFTIATGTSSGYASNFTNSGVYNLGLSGNGYIIFEYIGNSSGITTTIQIDDIVIN